MEDYAACKLLAAVKCSLAYKDIRVSMKKKKKRRKKQVCWGGMTVEKEYILLCLNLISFATSGLAFCW